MSELWRTADIKRNFKYSYKKSKQIFDAAKKIDNDPYHLRPTEVPAELVFKALGLSSRSFTRYMENEKSE